MKTFFFISIIFFSCTPNTGQTDSSQVVVIDPEIVKLKIIVADQGKIITAQGKIITALTNRHILDSINSWRDINAQKPLTAKVNSLTGRHIYDSVKTWAAMKPLIPLPLKVYSSAVRAYNDSVNQWAKINSVLPLILKVGFLKADSVKQWVEINKLKQASPVVQIPIMQNDIKNIQSKNTSQDKTLISHTSSIKNIDDTLNVLKVTAGSDFDVDARKIFKISAAGMVRIKQTILPQP